MISLTGLSADLRVKVVPNGNGTFARPHTRQTNKRQSVLPRNEAKILEQALVQNEMRSDAEGRACGIEASR